MPNPTNAREADVESTTRRRVLRSVGAATLVGFAGCAAPRGETLSYSRSQAAFDPEILSPKETYPADDDVTMFRGGLRRLGYYPDAVVPGSVAVDWSRPVNEIGHTAAKSSPLPAPDGETILIPADTGRLHAVTPGGEERWSVQTRATHQGFHGTPVVAHGVAYIGGYDGAMYAFDVETGDLLWRTDAFDDPVAIGSSPGYWDGVLYVAVEYRNPKSGALWAVDAETGTPMWSDDRIWGMPHPSIAIDPEHERLVTASNDGVCYAWEFPSLEFEWAFQTGSGDDGMPDGEPQYGGEFYHGAEIKGTTALFDGAAFFGSWDGSFYRVALEDGTEEWSVETNGRVMCNPAVDPERNAVFVGGHDRFVRALDVDTGDELWSTNVGGTVIGSLSVTAETVLVGSYDTHLYALEKETGTQRWRVENNGHVTSEAVPHDGRIYYAERASISGYWDDDEEEVLEEPGNAYCLVPDE